MKKSIKIILYSIISLIIAINILILINNLIKDNKKYKKENNYEIKLNGKSKIDLELNEPYEDEGAISKFNNKAINIKQTGTVNTKKIDKYIIKYSPKVKEIICYNIYRMINIIDNEKPIIKLKGSKEVVLYIGNKYIEAGYEVTDNSEEDLTKKVEIENNVNWKKAGTYEIKYTVKDSNDNEASITRKITIKEKEVTTHSINKVNLNDKGSVKKENIDLNKNNNTITAMSFTNTGIAISGYVKNGNGNYSIKLCKNNSCTSTKMTASKTYYYNGNINLTNLANGTYTMKIAAKNDMDAIMGLSESSRIVRAKVGNKLVTLSYNNNKPSIKIENFAYQYDILISPGHGGSDNGATNLLIKEKDLNLTVSLYEKKRYEQHGLKVKMIRENDTYGLMMGPTSESNISRRARAVGYYGAVSHYAYSNHHNSIGNNYYSGWEILLVNQGTKDIYKIPYKVANEWTKAYPVTENHLRIYGRNYDTDALLNKSTGQTYNKKNWYAMQRVPYELYNVYTVTYEGCYLSNMNDYNWYINNWKKLSEIKIKYYVESLGKTYIPN